jgi:hypothetical protein
MSAAPAMRTAEGMYTKLTYCGASGPEGFAVNLVDISAPQSLLKLLNGSDV